MTITDEERRGHSPDHHVHMEAPFYEETLRPFLEAQGYAWDHGCVTGWDTIVYVKDRAGHFLTFWELKKLLRSVMMRRAVQDGSWSAENYRPNILRSAQPYGQFPRVRPPLPGYVFLVTRGWRRLTTIYSHKARGGTMKKYRAEGGWDAFRYLEEKRYREAARYVDDEVHLADPDNYDEDEEEW